MIGDLVRQVADRITLPQAFRIPMRLRVEGGELVVQWYALCGVSLEGPDRWWGAVFTLPKVMMGEEDAFLWIRACMQATLLHDFDEFVRLDGERVAAPHDEPRFQQPTELSRMLYESGSLEMGLRLALLRHTTSRQSRALEA